jgi:hypothetical protein
MKNQQEFILQKAVCNYLNVKYPDVLFLSDTIASLRLTTPQQVRNKSIQKQGFKCPDLLILEPNRHYKGLFIELKIKSPFKKNGELYVDEHLQGQQKSMQELTDKGYLCFFKWEFDDIKELIKWYMSNR